MHDFKGFTVLDIVEKSAGAYICLKKTEENTVDFYTTYINQAFENTFHISKDELEGVLFTALLEDMSFNKNNLIELIILVEKSGRTYRDTIYSYKYGKYYNLSVSKLSDGNICCMFVDLSDYQQKSDSHLVQELELLTQSNEQLSKDINELKRKHLELGHMANFDPNTNTYNKNYFVNFLSAAIKKAEINSKTIQVLYIDINNFKKVNYVAGFYAGDEVIAKFAKILLKYESSNVKVGRFCNDEFVIAIYDAKNEQTADSLYEKIAADLAKPILLDDGQEFYLTITAGIANYPGMVETADEVIKCANIAMCKAKNNTKTDRLVFEESMLTEFIDEIHLETRLKNAVEHGDFMLHFQPQYDSLNMRLRGVEALIRWDDVEIGSISPGKFIPIAENNGYIIELGIWVIDEALKAYSVWKHEYGFKGIISINISAIQLEDKNFTEILLSHIEKYNVCTNDVEIEITESVFITDFALVGEVIKDLRNKGLKISLDDFGTGYSSLSYLKNIPIDTLKIDQSFINTMVADPSTSIITSSVIEMVKKLGFETIAEGVETEEQFKFLRNINCDNIQGFYLGRPMKKEDILKLIIEENRKIH